MPQGVCRILSPPTVALFAHRGSCGERISADAVITAIDPQQALLSLLNPPLAGAAGADLAAARRSNVVQALVHVATDRLPPYPAATPDDYTGLQSYVDTLEGMRQGFIQAEARRLPDPLPLYAFTMSAIDSSVAPAGGHTIYLACPAAPGMPAWPVPPHTPPRLPSHAHQRTVYLRRRHEPGRRHRRNTRQDGSDGVAAR